LEQTDLGLAIAQDQPTASLLATNGDKAEFLVEGLARCDVLDGQAAREVS
jgi:hypothetical protein